MIEWLSQWLKQIILLVLIATFIDLLLPSNSMDRYVKIVMGLLIIMAILSPALEVFHQKWDFSTSLDGEKEVTSLTPLYQIKEKGEQLQKNQSNLIQSEVEASIGQTVTKQLTEKFKVEVTSMNVTVPMKEGEPSQIKKIQVTARMPTEESIPSHMKPIEPVSIHATARAPDKTENDAQRMDMIRRITQYLQQTWNLIPEQINVRVESAW